MKSYLNLIITILLLASFILVQAAPNVSFTASTTSGAFPLAVNFNATASDSQSGTLQYFWTFGDGNQTNATGSAGRIASNTYMTNGTFTVTLTVMNLSTFQTGTATKTITVNIPTGTYTFPLDVEHDAHLKNGTSTNDGNFLRTGNGYVGYLKYQIPNLPGTITGAKLQLTYSILGGQNGSVVVAQGSNTNWTEGTLSNSNRPSNIENYGTINTNTSTVTYTRTLTLSDVSEGGVLNIILTSNNPSYHNFTSSEGMFEEDRPKLVLTVDNAPASPPCNYQRLSGWASDIGSGGGKTFVVGGGGRVYERLSTRWQAYPAGPIAKTIDVDGNGRPWITATDNKIYRWTGSAWQLLPGRALDIGCNGSHVYVIGTNKRIYRFNGSSWSIISSGAGLRIDVASDGNPWVIGTNYRVYQYHNGRWLVKGNLQAEDIGIRQTAPNVYQVWVVHRSNHRAYYYEGGGQYTSFSGHIDHITVADDGTIWVINRHGRIYRKKCSSMPAAPNPSTREDDAISEADSALENRNEQLEDRPPSVKIYPNPTIDFLSIEGIEDNTTNIEIFNAVGALVIQHEVGFMGNSIDVSQLQKGMYVLVIQQNGKQQTQTFIKQ